ncbi:unnamed protein product [Caenorhabditis auriculariae]|uniref:CUB-like domain-containing protein n=1 Tax=Caenorhabditis auriculariae TaxID=2777116 RepID=A0A8S1H9C7_9PELO|nr:unnamed protein product [Caenorhabditis auriculariae]
MPSFLLFAAIFGLTQCQQFLPLSEFDPNFNEDLKNIQGGMNVYVSYNEIDKDLLDQIVFLSGGVSKTAYEVSQSYADQASGLKSPWKLPGNQLTVMNLNNATKSYTVKSFLYIQSLAQSQDPTIFVYDIVGSQNITRNEDSSTIVLFPPFLPQTLEGPKYGAVLSNISQAANGSVVMYSGIPPTTINSDANRFFRNPLRIDQNTTQFFTTIEPLQVTFPAFYILVKGGISFTAAIDSLSTQAVIKTSAATTTGLIMTNDFATNISVVFYPDRNHSYVCGYDLTLNKVIAPVTLLYVQPFFVANSTYSIAVIDALESYQFAADYFYVIPQNPIAAIYTVQYFQIQGALIPPSTTVPVSTAVPPSTTVPVSTTAPPSTVSSQTKVPPPSTLWRQFSTLKMPIFLLLAAFFGLTQCQQFLPLSEFNPNFNEDLKNIQGGMNLYVSYNDVDKDLLGEIVFLSGGVSKTAYEISQSYTDKASGLKAPWSIPASQLTVMNLNNATKSYTVKSFLYIQSLEQSQDPSIYVYDIVGSQNITRSEDSSTIVLFPSFLPPEFESPKYGAILSNISQPANGSMVMFYDVPPANLSSNYEKRFFRNPLQVDKNTTQFFTTIEKLQITFPAYYISVKGDISFTTNHAYSTQAVIKTSAATTTGLIMTNDFATNVTVLFFPDRNYSYVCGYDVTIRNIIAPVTLLYTQPTSVFNSTYANPITDAMVSSNFGADYFYVIPQNPIAAIYTVQYFQIQGALAPPSTTVVTSAPTQPTFQQKSTTIIQTTTKSSTSSAIFISFFLFFTARLF